MPYSDPILRAAFNRDYQRTYYHTRKDRVRAYTQSPERRLAARERARMSRLNHPEKIKARNAVNNAIRDGRLKRESCEVCGQVAQAHHDDYSKPLEVKWLCRKHHDVTHGHSVEE